MFLNIRNISSMFIVVKDEDDVVCRIVFFDRFIIKISKLYKCDYEFIRYLLEVFKVRFFLIKMFLVWLLILK